MSNVKQLASGERQLLVPKYKIALCRFPGDSVEHTDTTSWLMRTLVEMKMEQADPEGHIAGILEVKEVGTPITMLRNLAVKKARLHACDYILMIDSDMAPDYLVGEDPLAVPFWKTAWKFMMDRRQLEDQALLDCRGLDFPEDETALRIFRDFPPATIAAPYCGPPPEELCYVFHWQTFETIHPKADHRPEPFALRMIEREDAARRSGLEQVAALPTGLILYDARVFTVLAENDAYPWFDYEYNDNPTNCDKASTEDVYQTRNANFLGMPQYCLWDSWAGHWKSKMVRKPHILGTDNLHKSLLHAALSGRKQRERIRFQSRIIPPFEGAHLEGHRNDQAPSGEEESITRDA